MTLGDELTPVGKLSAAFLSPPSPVHLQFAYYQSSLVVEYLVKRHGFEALGSILDDLGAGTAINEALARRAGPLADLDREFVSFARARAEGLAPRADWRQPDLPPGADSAALASWNAEHPRSFWGLQRQAQQLVSERKWEEAKRPLREMLELYPAYTGPDNAHLLLAAVHRELGEADAERAALEQLAALDAAAAGVTLRLLEIAAAAADWKAVALHADRLLAVNPLLRTVHRERARAAEELGDSARAIESHRAHLALEPVDRAEVHYRLARLLDAGGDRRAARRQALQAVEEAPRFRAAQRLLLAIVRASPPEENAPPPPAGKAREF
jgi:tetratricopeptide (TPR) repeat protein